MSTTATVRDERCGTPAGYQAHTSAGTVHCADCRQARREYENAYDAHLTAVMARQSAAVRAREKEQNDARYRAWVRLSRMHPAEYAALYAEELG